MINTLLLEGKKLFAVISEQGYIVDCWAAETLKEAQTDNPNKKIIEVTKENSPFRLGSKYFLKE